jgi:hypothetical protein
LNNFKILIIFKFNFYFQKAAKQTEPRKPEKPARKTKKKPRNTNWKNRKEKTLGALMGRGRYPSASRGRSMLTRARGRTPPGAATGHQQRRRCITIPEPEAAP